MREICSSGSARGGARQRPLLLGTKSRLAPIMSPQLMALGSPRPRKESSASNRMAATMRGGSAMGRITRQMRSAVGGVQRHRTGGPDIVELLDPEELGPGETGDRRPAHHPDRDGDGDEARAEQADQRHREEPGGEHLEELGDPHKPLVEEPAVESGRRADGDADDHADGGGTCTHCEGDGIDDAPVALAHSAAGGDYQRSANTSLLRHSVSRSSRLG